MGTDDKLLKEIKNICKVKKIPLEQVFNYVNNLRVRKKKQDIGEEIFFLFIRLARPLWGKKGWSKRKAMVRVAKHLRFKKILDKYFKGADRKAFEDTTLKEYTEKSFIKDLRTVGLYKRYKLIENYLSTQSNELLDLIFDRKNYQILSKNWYKGSWLKMND
tara:strand:- start:388 stop:870 length:483 start_codon:yes stop_codon:yes gene_type:complete